MNLRNFSWKVILLGLGLAVGIFLATRFVFSPIWQPTARFVLVMLGAPLGTFAGAYYAAREASSQPILHGMIAAVSQWLVLFVFRALPVLPLLWLAMLLAGALGVYLAIRSPYGITSSGWGARAGTPSRRRTTWLQRNPISLWRSKMRANALYQTLLRRVRNDQGIADRLIDLERRRNPFSTREILIRNALERLDRDNR